MAITTTNKIVSPALRSQSVRVHLETTDIAKLASITIGMLATISSSSKTGRVDSVDLYGTSYTVKPDEPDHLFDSSSTPGQLALNETVTLT